MTTISVLLPVYNGAATLERALSSVLLSRSAPDEIIIVNDGSTDDTGRILTSFRERAPNVRIVDIVPNAGLRNALNVGLASCTSEFVARLDADDEWREDHVGNLRQAVAENPSARLVATAYELRDGEQVTLRSMPASIGRLIRDNIFGHSAVCIRRAAMAKIEGYQAHTFEDYATWIRLIDEPSDCVFVTAPSVVIHVLPNSLSRIDRLRALELRHELQMAAYRKYADKLLPKDRLIHALFLAAFTARLWCLRHAAGGPSLPFRS